jgi:hypothetical protein
MRFGGSCDDLFSTPSHIPATPGRFSIFYFSLSVATLVARLMSKKDS